MSETEPAPTVAAPPPGLWARACFGERAALGQLADRFWYPVYAWLRACGTEPDAAALQCSNFFTLLHEAAPPARDDPAAARFREFVLTRLKSHLVQGAPGISGAAILECDAHLAERRYAEESPRAPDDLYARRWSLRVLELSIEALQAEYGATDKAPLFVAMKPFLGFKTGDPGYAEAAKAIEMSASAFHLQVFNFRKRYRALLRAQIADTVRHPDDVDSELTVLLVGAS